MAASANRSLVGIAFVVASAALACGGGIASTDENANRNNSLTSRGLDGSSPPTMEAGSSATTAGAGSSAMRMSSGGSDITSTSQDSGAPASCDPTSIGDSVCETARGPASPVFKGCAQDSDCTMIRATSCTLENHDTNTLTAYGVAKSKAQIFEQCFPVPALDGGCFPVPSTRVNTLAEDGTSNLEGGVLVVKCVKTAEGCGLCKTSGR